MAKKAVSCVSRAMRAGEVEGYDYFFKTNDEMKSINRDLFFNFEERPGGIYGMLWSEITKSKKLVILCGKSGSGKDTLLRGNEEMEGFMSSSLFGDDVNFAIFDHDGVNNILAVEDKLAEQGVDVFVVWVDIPEHLRRERVTARDGNSERADNCWVEQPKRIDLIVNSNPKALSLVDRMLNKSVFVPDFGAPHLFCSLDNESAFCISNQNSEIGKLFFKTPREAIKAAQEMISVPHASSGMMLDVGHSYWVPDIFAAEEGYNAEYIWDMDDFDFMLRSRGLICSSPEAATNRALAMLNTL